MGKRKRQDRERAKSGLVFRDGKLVKRELLSKEGVMSLAKPLKRKEKRK